MEKPAETTYPIHDLLRRRWSPRAFAERTVEPEKMRSLFEAARWSASSFNEQPWVFLFATKDNPAEFDRMLGCLNERNQRWAEGAPVLMIAVAKLHFEHNGEPNRWAYYDTGQAAAYLTVEATSLGLFVHQMAGFDREKVRERYGVPANHDPVAAIALGYAGSPESLPEDFRERERAPRQRRPTHAFVFESEWGRPAPLVAP